MHIDYIVQIFLLDPHNRKAAIDERTHVERTIPTHLAAILSFLCVTAGRTTDSAALVRETDRAEKRLRMRAVDSFWRTFWRVFDCLINESLPP